MDINIVSRQKPIYSTNTEQTEWELELKATGNYFEIYWYKQQLDAIGASQPIVEGEQAKECGVDFVEKILIGIDLTETESDNGWWETSAGAMFGKRKKIELLEAIQLHILGTPSTS